MTTALFTFKVHIKYKDANGKLQESVNINYINPAHVISAFWETLPSGARLLNAFTGGSTQDKDGNFHYGRTFTFTERDGTRFIEHVEEYHCLLLQQPQQPQQAIVQNRRTNRRPMNIISEEIIEEDGSSSITTQASFEE